MRSKRFASASRCSMYGSYILRNARSRTWRSLSSRNGAIRAGVISWPSQSTVIAPITFAHSVESFASSVWSGTLAGLKSSIWLRNRCTVVSRPARTYPSLTRRSCSFVLCSSARGAISLLNLSCASSALESAVFLAYAKLASAVASPIRDSSVDQS